MSHEPINQSYADRASVSEQSKAARVCAVLRGRTRELTIAPGAPLFLQAARAPLDRPRGLSPPEEGHAKSTFSEHCRVIEFIKPGDAEFAGAGMHVRFSRVATSIERALAQIESSGA